MEIINITIPAMVWSTLNGLPPGEHIVEGDDRTLREVRRLCWEYSNAVISRTMSDTQLEKPWICYPWYRGKGAVPNHMVVKVTAHKPIDDFNPRLTLTSQVAIAMERLRKGEDRVVVVCHPSKISQVRNYVYRSKSGYSVDEAPNGCVLHKERMNKRESIAAQIREQIILIRDGRIEFGCVPLSSPTQFNYAAVLVSQIGTSFGIRLTPSIAMTNELLIQKRKEPIEEDFEKVIKKWMAKGMSLDELISRMNRTVDLINRTGEAIFVDEPSKESKQSDEVVDDIDTAEDDAKWADVKPQWVKWYDQETFEPINLDDPEHPEHRNKVEPAPSPAPHDDDDII
jgi:hypothetical protein